jgi:DNA-binding response OmpR family regulator
MLRAQFENYVIMTVESGLEGLRYAKDYPPAMILLDFVLPDINGDAFCNSLRQSPALAQVPVVLMSGLALDFSQVQKSHANVVACLAKPFKFEELVAEMNRGLKPIPSIPSSSPPEEITPALATSSGS